MPNTVNCHVSFLVNRDQYAAYVGGYSAMEAASNALRHFAQWSGPQPTRDTILTVSRGDTHQEYQVNVERVLRWRELSNNV